MQRVRYAYHLGPATSTWCAPGAPSQCRAVLAARAACSGSSADRLGCHTPVEARGLDTAGVVVVVGSGPSSRAPLDHLHMHQPGTRQDVEHTWEMGKRARK